MSAVWSLLDYPPACGKWLVYVSNVLLFLWPRHPAPSVFNKNLLLWCKLCETTFVVRCSFLHFNNSFFINHIAHIAQTFIIFIRYLLFPIEACEKTVLSLFYGSFKLWKAILEHVSGLLDMSRWSWTAKLLGSHVHSRNSIKFYNIQHFTSSSNLCGTVKIWVIKSG